MQETLTIKALTTDEYIKRESAIEAIMSDPPDAHYQSWYAEKIKAIPAADVVPVRHGRWEWFEEWNQSTPESKKECIDCGWRCGRCKVNLDDMVGWYWDDPYDEPKLNWCPNCGMRADEQNELNIN